VRTCHRSALAKINYRDLSLPHGALVLSQSPWSSLSTITPKQSLPKGVAGDSCTLYLRHTSARMRHANRLPSA
ncbi:MAG: hypothetical protein VX223_10090, partial [Myxococcota bacterium]|nr:hypothetical protein [Myxococcota bacterium]